MSDKKLVYFATVASLSPLPGKDRVLYASFEEMTWKTMVGKEDFKIGDKAVFFEVDSAIEDIPELEFLKARCWRAKCSRSVIRQMKIKGLDKDGNEVVDYSQGLACPVSSLQKYISGDEIKIDVKNIDDIRIAEKSPKTIEIDKKKHPIKNFIMKVPILRNILLKFMKTRQAAPIFPTELLSKTDEVQFQNIVGELLALRGRKCYVSQKVDGNSNSIFIHKGNFYVCSRNFILYKKPLKTAIKELNWSTKDLQSDEWKYNAAKYDFALRYFNKDFSEDICFQFENVGIGIQGNKLNLKDREGLIFNIFNKKIRKYYSYEMMTKIIGEYESSPKYKVPLKLVKYLPNKFENNIFYIPDRLPSSKDEEGNIIPNPNANDPIINKLRELAEGKYDNGYPQEGIVIRFLDNDERFIMQAQRGMQVMGSFKVISESFREKQAKD